MQRRAQFQRRMWADVPHLAKNYATGIAYGAGWNMRPRPAPKAAKPKLRSNYQRQKYKRTVTQGGKRLPKKKGVKRDVAKLKNAVKELRHSENASLGKLTWRQGLTYNLLAPTNTQAHTTYGSINAGTIETAGSVLQYYNPSNPEDLVTAPLADGTYSRKILVKSATSKVQLRNNYRTDANVTVYLCKIRDDTNQTPSDCFNNVTDNSISGDAQTIGMYPSDSELMKQLWHTKKMFSGTLEPGKTVDLSHTVGPYEYDPATVDTHNQAYQREYKAFAFLVILKGSVCHDSAASTNIGYNQAGLDIYEQRILKIEYDAGINIERVFNANVFQTPTESFVQSNQPVPANTNYKVSGPDFP